MVRGDQRVARECYSTSVKQKAVNNIYLDELDMHDYVNTRPEPSEELEPVPLDDNPEHLAYIGSKLAEDLRSLLTHFLKQNKDVFAWKQADMRGIDPAIITHRLNVSPSFKPVKKKRRSFAPERQKAINEEVGKLLQAGAIREVEYLEWLANVVLVKKANGKWRLCIDSSVTLELSWMDPVWDYLIEGLLPNDSKEASKLRARSARFTVHRGSLYKQGFFTPILKCIAGKDANYVLREVHEGVCENHIGARALTGKALRQGYYWPTMLRDATDLVRKCKI